MIRKNQWLWRGLSLTLAALTLPVQAFAQSTPTELADLSLEDLLDVEVIAKDVATNDRWEISAAFRKLDIGGYKTGTTDLTFGEVLFSPGETRTSQNYPVVPTFICQSAFTVSARYKLNETTAIGVQVPILSQETEHISSVPGFADFTLTSKGVGDIAISLTHKAISDKNKNLSIQAGIRVPTGDINVEGDTPRNGTGTLERLPYTMQLGSGTLDLTGAVNYSWTVDDFKFRSGANAVIRTGTNANNYRLGNNFGLSASMQYIKPKILQPYAKLSARKIERIEGLDTGLTAPGLFPFPASITDPFNYGGEKIGVAAGLKTCISERCNVYLSGEFGVPIYQNLNGIQPKEKSNFSISVGSKF